MSYIFCISVLIGTDQTWLEKLNANHLKHPNYDIPRTSKNTFVVKHYAGEVSLPSISYQRSVPYWVYKLPTIIIPWSLGMLYGWWFLGKE